jgi:Animal haem peroxidase
MADAFYSFGISHPGAITLHNYPDFLRHLPMKDENGDSVKDDKGNEVLLDLAAVDIMRDRERGVSRYNQFRQLLHRPPIKSFEEITSNRVWAQEISDVYGGDIDRVDLMVGMFAEDLPAGFGFSDTAGMPPVTFRFGGKVTARSLQVTHSSRRGWNPLTRLRFKNLRCTDRRCISQRILKRQRDRCKCSLSLNPSWP